MTYQHSPAMPDSYGVAFSPYSGRCFVYYYRTVKRLFGSVLKQRMVLWVRDSETHQVICESTSCPETITQINDLLHDLEKPKVKYLKEAR